jgi:hypothetical protein
MSQRLKSISRIARLLDHQKEAIEMEVLQTRQKLDQEQNNLADLENRLEMTIGTFEKDMNDKVICSSREVTYLYGVSSFISNKIEVKQTEVQQIDRKLRAQEDVLLAAFRKQKVFGLFKNKLVAREKRTEALLEQKSQDFLNLVTR